MNNNFKPQIGVSMLCALIQNNLVAGIADLDEPTIQSLGPYFQQIIDVSSLIPTPGIGWAFDGVNISGTNVSTKITKLAFRERFTTGELTAIFMAMPTNFTLQAMEANQAVATYVDLARTDTAAAMGYLVSLNLLTSLRANTILTTIPTATELYNG